MGLIKMGPKIVITHNNCFASLRVTKTFSAEYIIYRVHLPKFIIETRASGARFIIKLTKSPKRRMLEKDAKGKMITSWTKNTDNFFVKDSLPL